MGKHTVVRDVTITFAATGVIMVLLQLASILTVRTLGIAGRGTVAASVLIPTIVAYGGWLGLPVATGYWINTDPSQRSVIIGTVRTLALGLSICLSVISLLLSYFLSLNDEVRVTSMLFTLFIPLQFFVSINQAVLQADMRSVAFNLVRISGSVLYLVILVLLSISDVATPRTFVLAQLGGSVAWLVISTVSVNAQPWFAFHGASARSIIAFGARAHLGSMSPVDGLRVDQLILAIFLSVYDLGLYVIAMTFVTANRMIGLSMGMIAFPLASRQEQDATERKSVPLFFLVVTTLGLSAVVATLEIIFGADLLRLFFDVSAVDAQRVMTILVVGSVFMNGRQVCSDILRGLGRPGIPTVCELLALVSMAIMAIALWNDGLVGVSLAVAVSSAMAFVAILILGFVPQFRS